MTKPKILITGSNGYIATQFLHYLKDKYEFVGLVREGSESKNEHLLSKTIYYNGDFSDLNREFHKTRYAAVFHLAVTYRTDETLEADKELLFNNVIFSSQLMSACARHKVKFIAASTFSMYNKNHDLQLNTFYDTTKYAMGELAKTYLPFSAVFIHLSDTYGPNDHRKKVHNLIFNDKLKELNASGNQMINYTHVEDIARAFSYVFDSLENKGLNDCFVYHYDLFYPENNISFSELANILDKDVKFLGVAPAKDIPVLKDRLPEFELKHNVKDMKETFLGKDESY